MTRKERYTFHQNGNNHTVIDEEENVPLIMIEFKDDEFPVYACFHRIIDRLNEREETIKKQNQEILSCHDTLVTIEALCDAVLNYDFKNVMDNKDLMFLKECFEAIRNNDLKQMTSLTVECMGDVE